MGPPWPPCQGQGSELSYGTWQADKKSPPSQIWDRVSSVVFSPDGTLLAEPGEAMARSRLWDVSEWTGQQTITTVEQAMPHTLTKVSGDGQEGTVGATLAKPFVVSVLDQNGSAFAGAVVSFFGHGRWRGRSRPPPPPPMPTAEPEAH